MPAAVPRMMQRMGADLARMAPAQMPVANAGNAGLGYDASAALKRTALPLPSTEAKDGGKRHRIEAPVREAARDVAVEAEAEAEEVIASSSPPRDRRVD